MVYFIFHRKKIFVPLHELENIHYLFYITCTKIQALKNDFSSSKSFYKSRLQIYAESIARTLVLC